MSGTGAFFGSQAYGTQQQHAPQRGVAQQAPSQAADPRGVQTYDRQLQAQGYERQAGSGVDAPKQPFGAVEHGNSASAHQPIHATQPTQTPIGYQATQPIQQGRAQQPIQQDPTQQPIQQGFTQQPVQQGLTQQPIQQSHAQQPSQQGFTQQPIQQDPTQQPVQQGRVQQPAMSVESRPRSAGGGTPIDVPMASGRVDEPSVGTSRQAALGAFQGQLPGMASASGRQFTARAQEFAPQAQGPVPHAQGLAQRAVGEQFQRAPSPSGFAADASAVSKIPLRASAGDLSVQKPDRSSPTTQQSQYAQAQGIQSDASKQAPIQGAGAIQKPRLDDPVTLQDGTVTTVGSLLSQASMDASTTGQQYGQQYRGTNVAGDVTSGTRSGPYGEMPVSY